MRLPRLDAQSIQVIERCIARLLRALHEREDFEVQPSDAVWPVLHNYPYGPAAR